MTLAGGGMDVIPALPFCMRAFSGLFTRVKCDSSSLILIARIRVEQIELTLIPPNIVLCTYEMENDHY